MARKPIYLLPFDKFLKVLRDQGFQVSVRQRLQLQEIWRQIDPEMSREDLKYLLAPVFSSTPTQQQRFYQLFDAFFDQSIREVISRFPEEKGEEQKEEIEPDAPRFSWKILLLGVLVLVLGFVGIWAWMGNQKCIECEAKGAKLSVWQGMNLLGQEDYDDDCVPNSADQFPNCNNWVDQDEDGIPDECDNCPIKPNPEQKDQDEDGIGAECDECDNLPSEYPDLDKDCITDQEDPDDDGDGILDSLDFCPRVASPDNTDPDGDGRGNPCDNCPEVANPLQENMDGDSLGDLCDQDRDGDGIENEEDLCPDNPDCGKKIMEDLDRDEIGDCCDNCPETFNPEQKDGDGNGVGDVCQKQDSLMPWLQPAEPEPWLAGTERIQALQTPPNWLGRNGTWLFGLGAGLLLLLWGINTRREKAAEKAQKKALSKRKGPFLPILTYPETGFLIHSGRSWRNLFNTLRRREEGSRLNLDVPGTLKATAEAGGHPEFRFRPDSRPTEYLFLIEKNGENDQQAQLFTALVETLQKEELFVEYRYFTGDPRVLRHPVTGQRNRLEHLLVRFPEHRLVILGDGRSLIDSGSRRLGKWTKTLKKWPETAILTPRQAQHWGKAEEELAKPFILLPGTRAGLERLTEFLGFHGRPEPGPQIQADLQNPPAPVDGELLTFEAYREYLGPKGFQLLCALALYPEMDWKLTLHLSNQLSDPENPLLAHDQLLKLVRLPFLRNGDMPQHLRHLFVRQLEPENEKIARKTLLDLLRQSSAEPGTHAHDLLEKEKAWNLYASSEKKPADLNRLRTTLSRLPVPQLKHDINVWEPLQGLQFSRIQGLVKPKWWKALFREGMPWLGIQGWLRHLWILALVLLTGLGWSWFEWHKAEKIRFGGETWFVHSDRERVEVMTHRAGSEMLRLRENRQKTERRLFGQEQKEDNYTTLLENLAPAWELDSGFIPLSFQMGLANKYATLEKPQASDGHWYPEYSIWKGRTVQIAGVAQEAMFDQFQSFYAISGTDLLWFNPIYGRIAEWELPEEVANAETKICFNESGKGFWVGVHPKSGEQGGLLHMLNDSSSQLFPLQHTPKQLHWIKTNEDGEDVFLSLSYQGEIFIQYAGKKEARPKQNGPYVAISSPDPSLVGVNNLLGIHFWQADGKLDRAFADSLKDLTRHPNQIGNGGFLQQIRKVKVISTEETNLFPAAPNFNNYLIGDDNKQLWTGYVGSESSYTFSPIKQEESEPVFELQKKSAGSQNLMQIAEGTRVSAFAFSGAEGVIFADEEGGLFVWSSPTDEIKKIGEIDFVPEDIVRGHFGWHYLVKAQVRRDQPAGALVYRKTRFANAHQYFHPLMNPFLGLENYPLSAISKPVAEWESDQQKQELTPRFRYAMASLHFEDGNYREAEQEFLDVYYDGNVEAQMRPEALYGAALSNIYSFYPPGEKITYSIFLLQLGEKYIGWISHLLTLKSDFPEYFRQKLPELRPLLMYLLDHSRDEKVIRELRKLADLDPVTHLQLEVSKTKEGETLATEISRSLEGWDREYDLEKFTADADSVLGGEEILVISPQTNLDGITDSLSRFLQAKLPAYTFRSLHHEVMQDQLVSGSPPRIRILIPNPKKAPEVLELNRFPDWLQGTWFPAKSLTGWVFEKTKFGKNRLQWGEVESPDRELVSLYQPGPEMLLVVWQFPSLGQQEAGTVDDFSWLRIRMDGNDLLLEEGKSTVAKPAKVLSNLPVKGKIRLSRPWSFFGSPRVTLIQEGLIGKWTQVGKPEPQRNQLVIDRKSVKLNDREPQSLELFLRKTGPKGDTVRLLVSDNGVFQNYYLLKKPEKEIALCPGKFFRGENAREKAMQAHEFGQYPVWLMELEEEKVDSGAFFFEKAKSLLESEHRDKAGAIVYFRKARKEGFEVGNRYFRQLGDSASTIGVDTKKLKTRYPEIFPVVEASNPGAAEWDFSNLYFAGKKNDAEACYWLGEIFVAGYGISKDRAEGLRWLRKASQLGYELAGLKIQEIESDQISAYEKSFSTGSVFLPSGQETEIVLESAEKTRWKIVCPDCEALVRSGELEIKFSNNISPGGTERNFPFVTVENNQSDKPFGIRIANTSRSKKPILLPEIIFQPLFDPGGVSLKFNLLAIPTSESLQQLGAGSEEVSPFLRLVSVPWLKKGARVKISLLGVSPNFVSGGIDVCYQDFMARDNEVSTFKNKTSLKAYNPNGKAPGGWGYYLGLNVSDGVVKMSGADILISMVSIEF